MIEQGLFKRYFVGRDGFIWWIGQIAPESSWKDNIPGLPVNNNESILGFSERYRVRIMGYHTADSDRITDEELPWAYVMYPVTAGGGLRASSQSANLTQGTFVFGFFLDGEDAQTPVIMGVLGQNEYAAVSKNISNARFVPFSGYTPNDYIAYYSQNVDKGGEIVRQTGAQTTDGKTDSQGDKSGEPNNQNVNEAVTTSNSKKDAASEASSEEQSQPLAQSSDCDPIPLGKIQKDIQNIIVEIQKIRKSIYKYSSAVQNQISDIQETINGYIQKASKFVASSIKWVFKQVQKFVTNKVNSKLKTTYFLLFPNERPQLKTAVESINDLIACLFRKFINLLLSNINSFLQDAANKVINGAKCIVENLIANTLGQILGTLSGQINKALSSINSLVGQATSIAGDILGLLTDLLSFLSCEEKPACSTVNEWNILSGAKPISKTSIDTIVGKAKNLAVGVQNLTDADNFDFSLNFDNVYSLDACNIGPQLCGPPVAQFFGAETGTGALGNLIISAAGEVIGIDMISFGIGYDKTKTYGNVFDNCGKGKGAVIRPIVEDYTDDDGNVQSGIVDIEVIESGTGYLPAPDGSKGGNEYTWADPEDTIVKHPDGSYDTPKPPGNIITVNPGDEVTLPPGVCIVTEPQPGEQGGGEEICGGDGVLVTLPGVFTSPQPDFSRVSGNYPSLSTGSYPVILYLCDVIIQESGINYSEGDKIVIEPDIGAIAEPKFDSQGRVTSIKVTESGEGFTEYPQLYIQSDTGYNAVLRPRLCIDRVGDDKLKEPTTQDKIVTVIDCVGKV